MLLLCSGYLHLAPLRDPRRILDVGTGTGIWAIEMAEQYPEAAISGIDLSPVQPSWYGRPAEVFGTRAAGADDVTQGAGQCVI